MNPRRQWYVYSWHLIRAHEDAFQGKLDMTDWSECCKIQGTRESMRMRAFKVCVHSESGHEFRIQVQERLQTLFVLQLRAVQQNKITLDPELIVCLSKLIMIGGILQQFLL